jgi:hypothetical protein
VSNAVCQACVDLCEGFAIATPGQLSQAIRVVKANLADETLSDITQPAHSPSGRFADLTEKGPWPDYVEHYFKCNTCGLGFRLSVDTYHGVGGDWEPYGRSKVKERM